MQRPIPFDALDSRVVLVGYALVVAPVGLFVGLVETAWPGAALRGVSLEHHAWLRMVGVVAAGAGLMGLALGQIGSPVDRRRALFWFAVAHAWIAAMAFLMSPRFGDTSTRSVVFIAGAGALWLFAGWWRQAGDPEPLGVYVGLFGQKPASGTERVRSQYEQQIRLFAAQEERNRLARDLHDSVKQQVFAIQTAAATAEARLATDPSGARTALAQVREAARDSMAELDALLDQLQVAPLDNDSLVQVVRRQCEAVRLRTDTDVICEIGTLPPNAVLPPGTHLALARTTQEALSNAARHARASRIRVTLDRIGSYVRLRVSDNGSGYTADNVSAGMGLRNIRARADELGGETHITSRPGDGTTVLVMLPFADGAPRYYLKRTLLYLAVLAFFAFTSLVNWAQGRGRLSLLFMVPVLVDTVRYLLAWQRARRLRTKPT